MSYMDPRPERLNTEPAPPSVVETLSTPDHKTVTFDAFDVLRELSKWAAGMSSWQDEPKGPYLRDIITDARAILDAPTPAAQSAGQEAAVWPILKGIGKINGDGWKDTTKVGQIVYVWNAEMPAPYMAGQYPRIGNEGWSASTKQYDFTPATFDEIRDLFAAIAAPVNGGEREALRALVEMIDAGRSADYAALQEHRVMRRARAALSSPEKPCEYCDDTGDVHDQTGEWRGTCTCPAGVAISSPAKVGGSDREAFSDQRIYDKFQFLEGLVSERTYEQIAETAIGIARAALSADGGDRKDAIAYLDLGAGGYTDIGTDLTDEQLAALPKGRHMLGIIGTYGVDGYRRVLPPMCDGKDAERLQFAMRKWGPREFAMHVLRRGGDGDLSDCRSFVDAIAAKAKGEA